ncbi:hypothetical protein ACFSOX_23580, partial [Rhodoplanes azumiensis]
LAAQAEQLQASIAYFRTDESAAVAPATAVRRPAAGRSPVGKAPAKAAASEPTGRPVAGGANKLVDQLRAAYAAPARAAGKPGFRLDMTSGGPDAHDVQFERAS